MTTLQCGHGGEAVENTSSHGRRTLRVGRFNAATAVKPWRTMMAKHSDLAINWLQCGHGGEAVENEVADLFCTDDGFELQCGHGGEAVENIISICPSTTPLASLQCGHGGEAVENRLPGDDGPLRDRASMRPRR